MPLAIPHEVITQILRELIPAWTLELHIVGTKCSLRGLPKATDLRLVNKTIYDEIDRITWTRFSGQFDARPDLCDYKGMSYDLDGYIYKFISSLPQRVWDHISILHLDSDYAVKSAKFLTGIMTPRLQLVTLTRGLGYWIYSSGHPVDERFRNATTDAAMSGSLDTSIAELLGERRNSHSLVWDFWLSKMQPGRGGKLRTHLVMDFGAERIHFWFEIGTDDKISITERDGTTG